MANDAYEGTDPDVPPAGDAPGRGVAATDDDGLPGVAIPGYPGWRAGAFGHGGGALGLVRVSDPGEGEETADVYPAGGRVGALGLKALGDSPLTVCPVPDHYELNPARPSVHQGDGRFGNTRSGRYHYGDDFKAPAGTPVVAAGDGVVKGAGWMDGFGNQVSIDHGDGVFTDAAHLSRMDVKPGQRVKAGQQVGLSGRTGNVPKGADPHVHFEVRMGSGLPHKNGGSAVDPSLYLPSWCFQ